ncbi:Transposase (plasmid) [Borrelia hermsii YBT]|uniref:Transposase n=1 Tax=Borrelia hermsii YBT TaxID=1313295 RepID=W5T3K0_BORHE|nr:Transposase [Borrelia hermsii YBT]
MVRARKLIFNNHCVYSINYYLVLVTKYKHKYINDEIALPFYQIMNYICSLWKVILIEFILIRIISSTIGTYP